MTVNAITKTFSGSAPIELDDATDAITIRRSKCEPWERRFLAIVNCRGWHSKRVFFTKWHEMVHRIIEGQQLRLAFRKTYVDRTEPEEVLVDRVAAELAFYPSIFRPVIEQELSTSGKLTFDGVDRVRLEIAPEASRQKGTLQVKVQIRNPDRYLTPELSARVDFVGSK